jgi:zinc transport system ATP-binding protein
VQLDVLKVDDLCYRYNSYEVLRNVTFRVSAGDYLGIVGPNGSGKSTLVRAILGLIDPERGGISLFGSPLAKFSGWQKVGYLPQKLKYFNPNFPATVEEVVRLGLLAGKNPPKRLSKQDLGMVEETIEVMGIAGLKKRLIGDLSGGQQQRALLARAVAGGPELLILDEPTTALDPETRENFYELLERLNTERNTTIILVTHDTMSIGKYASRLLYLDKRVVFDGSFEDFCHSPEMTTFFGKDAQHMICHRH